MTACAVRRCTSAAQTRGLCARHYRGDAPAELTKPELAAVAFRTGVVDRLAGNPRRTTRTDAIGQAYSDGYGTTGAGE